MSKLTLAEVVNALQAQEQRRAYRQEESNETAFQAKAHDKQVGSSNGKKQIGWKKGKEKKENESNKDSGKKSKYPPCSHCKKANHTENYCWLRPKVKCRACNQLGHVEKICKNKGNQAHVVEEHEELEDQLFVVTCYAAQSEKTTWLVDSGCTNHMANDVAMFKDLDRTFNSKVKIGNGEFLDVKGK